MSFFEKAVPDGTFGQGMFALDLSLGGMSLDVARKVADGLARRDADRVTGAAYGLPACDVGMMDVQRDAGRGVFDTLRTEDLFRRR